VLVVVSLELQVFHEISWIYQNSQDCSKNSLNPKLIPKFPRSWENSQAVAALTVPVIPVGVGCGTSLAIEASTTSESKAAKSLSWLLLTVRVTSPWLKITPEVLWHYFEPR